MHVAEVFQRPHECMSRTIPLIFSRNCPSMNPLGSPSPPRNLRQHSLAGCRKAPRLELEDVVIRGSQIPSSPRLRLLQLHPGVLDDALNFSTRYHPLRPSSRPEHVVRERPRPRARLRISSQQCSDLLQWVQQGDRSHSLLAVLTLANHSSSFMPPVLLCRNTRRRDVLLTHDVPAADCLLSPFTTAASTSSSMNTGSAPKSRLCSSPSSPSLQSTLPSFQSTRGIPSVFGVVSPQQHH